MNIGERIRHRRIELGLTQTEFAKKMGLSAKSTVSKLENQGDNLTTDRIRRIAEVLECTPAYLMGWEDKIEIETNNNEHSEIIKKYIKLLSENTKMAPYIDKLRQLPPEYRNIAYTSINSVYEAYILTKEKEHEENNG